MHFTFQNRRQGTTLVELLLFLAFFALSSGVILAFFFSTTEQRIRQQTVMTVDQSGIQLLQTLSQRIRNAERVLYPALGASGTVLALQMPIEEDSPSIFALSGGTIVLVSHDSPLILGAERVVISNFVARNTSATSERQSVLISFTLSRSIPLTTPLVYRRPFEMLVTLFPDDATNSHCSCTAPACMSGQFEWQICDADVCSNATTPLEC